ncbi:protein-disulfide reductase DsbD family protein [Psychromonas ossibalaenae]|uniref:protein-disulfide reductase DsbD family protein n=1 Tax=Psychromonas ossibalaenae TaxID=444922 RepID=UPI000363128E|nr:protein-disulfide reductase DsbD domain-containing protein [Psychromonas ossibalaenae]
MNSLFRSILITFLLSVSLLSHAAVKFGSVPELSNIAPAEFSSASAKFSPVSQTSTGWLVNPNHPPVSVQMQLTGQSDPLLKTVDAVLQVKLEGDWKTYWRSPGEGGVAPSFDFSQSDNISDFSWVWPAPKRYPVLGVETLGYKHEVNFPITLQVQNPAEPVLLKGIMTMSSCTNICVLTDYDVELNFNVEDLHIDNDALFAFNQGIGAVPMKLDQQAVKDKTTSSTVSAYRSYWDAENQTLLVQVDNQSGWFSPDVFIDSQNSELAEVSYSAPEIKISDKQLTAKITTSSWTGPVDLADKSINITVVDKDLAVELSTTPSVQAIVFESSSIVSMFLIALLGGLILNIMPCVLPVLGMKLSSVISAHGIERSQIRKQFFASAAGILTSFWLLAGFLLILKFSGQALGWGIQFQSPYFITVMVVITALFAANMLGLFEIQLPSGMQTWLATKGGHSYLGHYMQGMFATLLATPCSAPFLGTAVAFALGASNLELLTIFSALGLGMAFPWILIALFPAIALRLPKPGKWMNSVKTLFALMILITCYWLLSLLTVFIGTGITLLTGLVLTVILLVLIARKRGKKVLITVLASLLAASVSGMIIASLTTSKWVQPLAQLDWTVLDTNVIDQQIKQGNIVFVDVTADWCITCKANKIGVLLQDPVYSALQGEQVMTMKGDWTVPSQDVTDYLQSYGRFGVPFNIVYGPGAPQGLPLATILTTDEVLSAIQQARGSK